MEQNTITRDDLMKRISKMSEIPKEAILSYYTMNNLHSTICDNAKYDELIEKLKNWVLYANAIIAGTEELHEWVCSTSDMPVDQVAEVIGTMVNRKAECSHE